jgi:serine/threonine protein phosphatase PrpC
MSGDRSGSTATIALIIGDTLYCANVGDSSAVLSQGKDKEPVRLTQDHKASKPEEKERIRLAGGIVVWYEL